MPAAPVASSMSDPIKGTVQILKGRLYYAALKHNPRTDHRLQSNSSKKNIHFFSIDSELVYWNFFLDFGPLNLGQLYRFCKKLNDKLEDPRLSNRAICFYSSTLSAKRANAVFLICCWQVLYLDRTPEEAFRGFRSDGGQDGKIMPSDNCSLPPNEVRGGPATATFDPLPPFHDASPCACTFDLTVLDCLRGLTKARMYRYFDFDNFDVEEYEYFEQVENGDLNWIMKDKILAFAGPHHRRQVTPEGYCTLTPDDYIPYFQRKNVSLVIRLNKKCYEESDFRKAGIQHVEQYYLDGSCPQLKILQRVLEAFESVPAEKAFAVHCKAGLGRTGTCIGAYMMKHYKFTAAEAIGWMRICRPGCVIGPQQQFLQDLEQRMWHEGDVMRSKPQQSRSLMVKLHDMKDDKKGGRHKRQEKQEQQQQKKSGAKSPSAVSMLSLESLTVQEQAIQRRQETEAIEGIEGQADALLSRRTQVQHQQQPLRSVGAKRQHRVKRK